MVRTSVCPDDCPLPGALLNLLQTCAECGSLRDDVLAEYLCQSPQTIHTNFKRINELLGTHERFAAVQMACRQGWIPLLHFAPPPFLIPILRNTPHSNCPRLGALHPASGVLKYYHQK